MTECLQLPMGTVQYECAGSGPAVVLVHALGPRAWGWPLERLTRDCTVIAMGRFDPGPQCPPSIAEMDLVLPVLQRMGVRQFTLCPWSMAGASAIAYAAARPPELEKLVLVDVAGLVDPELRRPAAQQAQAFSAAEWARHCAARWVHQAGPVRDLVEALGLEHASRLPQALEKTLEANRMIRQAPPPMELEKIAVPTLVLTGRHSLVLGPEAAQRAAQRLQRGSVVVFEHSAHALALEEAEKLQDVIAEFVLG